MRYLGPCVIVAWFVGCGGQLEGQETRGGTGGDDFGSDASLSSDASVDAARTGAGGAAAGAGGTVAGAAGVAGSPAAGAGGESFCDGPELTNCSGLCVHLPSNPIFCGSCDTHCGAGESCQQGVCECTEPGFAKCDGQCISTESDRENCGGCGNICELNESCEGGECVQQCDPGITFCTGECFDLSSDPESCGECYYGCAVESECVDGECRCPQQGQTDCGGECLDLSSNPESCGECYHYCGSDTACVDGACTCPDPEDTLCEFGCFNLQTDDGNCGTCDNYCSGPATCIAGQCKCGPEAHVCNGECVASFFLCDVEGQDPATHCAALADTDAERCQCDNCLDQLVDCSQNESCTRSWDCVLENQCTTPCWHGFGTCPTGTASGGRFFLPDDEAIGLLDALYACVHDHCTGVLP